MAVVLYHMPEDKSGRTAKKYKSARDAVSAADVATPAESNDGGVAAA
jgi:hypothetical protein